jgi:solute carrier family 25 (mitochondrial carnitine/acylcarnitine transporter), member 20/29
MQSAAMVGSDAAHRGPFQVLKHTLQHGGIRALYTGLALPIAAQGVYKGTVFTVNNVTQQSILDYRTLENHKTGILENGQLTMVDRFWCGFAGGAVNALLFVTPVEFVRNQLIAQHSRSAEGQPISRLASGSWDLMRHSIREHGFLSLWRGAGLSVARDAFGCGCFFYALAWTQRQLTIPGDESSSRPPPSFSATVVSGGLAGVAFWVVALPLDTVKTWIQSSDLAAAGSSVSAKESILAIYRATGYNGVFQQLFRGWQVAYGRGIPSAAITMAVYSLAYRRLQGGDEDL